MRAVTWARALLLVGLLACSRSTDESDDTSSIEAITSAEAATELGEIIASPATTLGGVGDAVLKVDGSKGTWTFYPYRSAKTASLDDESERLFLIVGSGGEVFFVDAVSGAGAGAMPAGVNIGEATRRLKTDLGERSASVQSIHVNGLPLEGLISGLASRAVAVLSELADSSFGRSITGVAQDVGARVVAYFTKGEAAGTAAETAPAEVGRAIVKLGERGEAVEVKSVSSSPGEAIVVRESTSLEILQKQTSGAVATTVEAGTAIIKSRPDTVWTPGGDPIDFVPAWVNPRNGAEFVVSADLSPEAAKQLADSGFKLIWILPSRAVKEIGEGKLSLPIKDGDAIIESASDASSRALVRSANRYLVKGWDPGLVAKSDAEFIESPIFHAIDGLARRLKVGDSPPTIELLAGPSGEVTGRLLDSTIARATSLLAGLGIRVTNAVIRARIVGLVSDPPTSLDTDAGTSDPSPDLFDAGSAPETEPGESKEPTTEEETSDGGNLVPSSRRKKKQADGCAASPRDPGPGSAVFGGAMLFALGSVVARRRRT